MNPESGLKHLPNPPIRRPIHHPSQGCLSFSVVMVLFCDGFTLWQEESPKWYDILSDLRLSVGSTIKSRESKGKGLKPLRLSTAHKASTLTRRSWFISLATPDTNLCTVFEGEDTLVLVPVGSSCRRNSFCSFPDRMLP